MAADLHRLHPDHVEDPHPRTGHPREAHGFGVFGGVACLAVEACPERSRRDPRQAADPQGGRAASPVDRQVVADFVTGFLSALAAECLDRGADLIGHLKAHLRTAHGTLRASLVDPAAGPMLVSNLTGDGRFETGELAVNAVVHGLSDGEVAAAVYAAAHRAAHGGLSVEWQTLAHPEE